MHIYKSGNKMYNNIYPLVFCAYRKGQYFTKYPSKCINSQEAVFLFYHSMLLKLLELTGRKKSIPEKAAEGIPISEMQKSAEKNGV